MQMLTLMLMQMPNLEDFTLNRVLTPLVMVLTFKLMLLNWTSTLKLMLLLSSLILRLLSKDSSLLTKLLSKTSKCRFSHSYKNCKPTPLDSSLTSPQASSQLSHKSKLLPLQIKHKASLNGKLPSRHLLKTSNKHGETLLTRPNTNGIKLKLLQIPSTRIQLLLSITTNNRELLSSMNWTPKLLILLMAWSCN